MCFKKFISLFKKKEIAPPPEVMAWQNDYLQYKKFSSKFNTIIKSIDKSFTIVSVDGYNGWGKTFFLKEWVKELKQQNEIAGYYNAWDINALDQPLPSFLNFLFEDLFTSYQVKRSVIQQVKNINQELFSLNTLGKLISKSPLSMLAILLEATKDADKRDIGAVLRELSSLQRREENIKDFKTQLENVVNKISGNKNLYIMVDNLDICRPKFIVEFLESIKYMLNIDGLVFVIAVSKDKSNVQKAISTILGPNFDMKSFADVFLHLPKQPMADFIKGLCKEAKLPKKSKDSIVDSFIFYAESLSLSLKTIEHCVKKIVFCLLTSKVEELFLPHLFSFLVILQSINTDVYEELSSSYQKNALEKIENEYKSAILNHTNGQEEWHKLQDSLIAFADNKSKISKPIGQIKDMLI